MAWNRIQAARLLTDKEMALFEGSLGDQAPRMSDKELQATTRRLRAQRDKYQDLLQRQRVATRGRTGTKSGPSGVANARTEQKVQVFGEALRRLETQQARRERTGGETGRKPTVRAAVRSALKSKTAGRPSTKAGAQRSAKAPAQGPRSRTAMGSDTQSPPTLPHTARAQAMGQERPLAHVSSRGRRQQARRDSR